MTDIAGTDGRNNPTNLHRELAPITPAAWAQIEEEAVVPSGATWLDVASST